MSERMKKTLLLFLPYMLAGLLATKLSQAWRLSCGTDISDKVMHFSEGLAAAFQSPLPSFALPDLLFGMGCGLLLFLAVRLKAQNAKKFRRNEEYGSARWGMRKDILPFADKNPWNNLILTQTEQITMDSRPKAGAKFGRNKNVVVIGGSGSGKTRFFVKPNMMQCTKNSGCSLVVTDPKGLFLIIQRTNRFARL